MRGLRLKFCWKLFGWDGFKTWFTWSFVHPIQHFVWLSITHKPYCLEHGWNCKMWGKYTKKCESPKLYTKKEIKKHWEEMEVEMNTLEDGEGGKCVYCGENDGTQKIPNPNFDKLNYWWVCDDCKEVIENQQKLSMCEMIRDAKGMEEAHNKLLEISQRTGKPSLQACIEKDKEGKYHSSSITFTGDKK